LLTTWTSKLASLQNSWACISRAFGSSATERVTFSSTLAIVLAGLVFRARGFLFGARALWLDESNWTLFLLENRFGDENLRPLGFMALTRVLVDLLSPTEMVLRALPWVSGVMTLLLAPFLARRLYSSNAARLLFVTVIALHPAAIDLSKEFKPYSTSLALHVGLLLATLRYAESRGTKELVPVLLVAGAGTFFAQDVVFAYPGVFAVVGWAAFKHRRTHLPWIGSCALLLNVALALQYALIWSRIPDSESTYWGNKYNVFHTDADQHSYLRWSFHRFREIAEFPGHRRWLWESNLISADGLEGLRGVDSFAWSFAWLLGLGLLVRRRQVRAALLLVLPCLVLWLFNALDFWPMGAFRTNLCVLLYSTAIAVVPFDGNWATRARRLAPVPAVLLVVVPLVVFERDWHASKRAQCNDGDLPDALRKLVAIRREKTSERTDVLLFSYGTCSEWEYYWRIHPDAAKFRQPVERYFVARCVKKRELDDTLLNETGAGARVWIVGNYKLPVASLAEAAADAKLELLAKTRSGSVSIVAFQSSDVSGSVDEIRQRPSSQFEDEANDNAAGGRRP
jgi:hypothetical protein